MFRQWYDLIQEKHEIETEQEQSKRKCILEKIDGVKEKKRIDAEINSFNDTDYELCAKAEVTVELTFVNEANGLR